jgi:hypothetical protein
MIPEDAPRQDRYCLVCKRPAMHWGLLTTTEEMVEDRDMRPSGSIEAWICSNCGHRDNVIDSPEPPTEQSHPDLERWEDEGGAPRAPS